MHDLYTPVFSLNEQVFKYLGTYRKFLIISRYAKKPHRAASRRRPLIKLRTGKSHGTEEVGSMLKEGRDVLRVLLRKQRRGVLSPPA